ncbi:MAG: HNH endonuclease [Candidatus Omnitrophica bacterium]|nr:HNH endonuclease [Candidatus Omnitrophota bacterium]
MAISQETRKALYKRANGRCECTMKVCGDHSGRCHRGLSSGYWDAHHRVAGGSDTLSNLIAMCATCHKNTRTYGR